MPDYFESGFSVKLPMWHGLGIVLDQYPNDANDAAHIAGLDWTVSLEPLMCLNTEIRDYRGIVRSDNQHVLGVVSGKYKTVQNIEMFKFMEHLIDDENVKFETAGSLKNGQIVWALTKLPKEEYVIPGTDDKNEVYLMVSTGHDGKTPFRCTVSGIRTVCWNTYSQNIREAVASWYIIHKGDPTSRVEEAKESLGLAINWASEFRDISIALSQEYVSEQKVADMVNHLFPVVDEMPKKAKTITEKNRLLLHQLINNTEVRMPTIAGTGWAAFNGVTELVDWHSRTKGNKMERIFEKAFFENKNELKNKALDFLMAS